MGCCGKKIIETVHEYTPMPAKERSRTKKLKSIISGNWSAMVKALKYVPDDKCDLYNARLRTCRSCENHTWLTWAEFFRDINDNGGLVKFVSQIADLESWPLLLRQEQGPKRKMFCRACKCFLMAKAASKDETCPLDKWKNLNDVKESTNG